MIPQYVEIKPQFIMQCYVHNMYIELSIPPYNTHGVIFPLEFTILRVPGKTSVYHAMLYTV